MWGGAADLDSLVAKIKDMQRNDANAKQQWISYVEQNGGELSMKRDPAKHDALFLQAFIQQLQSGAVFSGSIQSGGGAGGGGHLGEAIKMMQKRAPIFKEAWAGFCAMNGQRMHDPAKHDENFHAKFFEALAGGGGGGMGMAMGPMGMSAGGPPAKRMNVGGGMGMGMGGTGDPVKDGLVAQVKNYQRMGDEQKNLWWQYADTYLAGVRDPSRHDASTLHEFCQNHGIAAEGSVAAGGGGQAMMGGAGMMGGAMMGGAGGADKASLVERIKSYQRLSDEHKEVWAQFAGTNKRDPNKHDVPKLQEFATMQGI